MPYKAPPQSPAGRGEHVCLSVRQPWAELIARGDKPVENRVWPTKYRGPLVIHASKVADYGAAAFLRGLGWSEEQIDEVFTSAIEHRMGFVCLVDLADVVRDSPSPWALPDNNHLLVNNPRRLKFREWRGRLGLWRVTSEAITLA